MKDAVREGGREGVGSDGSTIFIFFSLVAR